jgi:hypothetical protein
MSLAVGKVKKIETEQIGDHKKTILTILSEDGQKSFVEFRGEIMMKLLENVSLEKKVIIPFKFDGKVSELGNKRYNNLVALSLKIVE